MEEKTFRNLQAVAVHLRANGFKVSKSTVYDHAKQRKIKSRDDGYFYLTDVEVYAASYLGSKKNNTPQWENPLQRRRNEAEARKMEAQANHWEIKSQVEAGNYVLRGEFERALAQRAMIFKIDLETFARSKAQEICNLVKGDNNLIPDLIEFMLEQFALFLNRYAEDREFVVPMEKSLSANDISHDDESDAEDLENQ